MTFLGPLHTVRNPFLWVPCQPAVSLDTAPLVLGQVLARLSLQSPAFTYLHVYEFPVPPLGAGVWFAFDEWQNEWIHNLNPSTVALTLFGGCSEEIETNLSLCFTWISHSLIHDKVAQCIYWAKWMLKTIPILVLNRQYLHTLANCPFCTQEASWGHELGIGTPGSPPHLAFSMIL